MARLEYFLVCESMSTDQETNRVSLFNVLEDIRFASPGEMAAPSVQSVPVPQFVAVACWNQEPGDEGQDFQMTVRLHLPGQAGQDENEFSLNFKMDKPRHRLALRFQGLPKLQPGQLKFELLLSGKHVAWHTVNVHPAEPAWRMPLKTDDGGLLYRLSSADHCRGDSTASNGDRPTHLSGVVTCAARRQGRVVA